MEWKIFYGDGSTFSSDDGTPEQAPGLDVQAIVQKNDEVGRTVATKSEFYIKIDDMWTGADLFGVLDQFISKGLLKAGRSLTNEDFKSILKKATEDPDFPPKSALLETDAEGVPR